TREAKAQAIDLRLDSRIALAPLGQYDGILKYLREAEVIARELGDRRRLGLVLADMGARLRNVGDHRRALEASRQAVEIATELDQLHTLIESYSALGGVHLEQGNLDLALRAFERGIELLRPHNVSDANLLSGLGHSYALSGRLSEAVSLLEDSTQREVSISSMGL